MGGSTLQLTPDAFSGRKLGKYEVLCRLSTGGMAEIFLASQRGLAGFRKLVVLKQILPDIKDEDEFVRMFLDEAKVTAAFNHPNIAQVFDLDVAEGELFLAMEFVQGATLVEVAKACRAANEPIPMGLSLAAARDTALALHYAHTFKDPLGRPSPVIHRDVAEKNIMVTYEGVTKLLDFGIAKSLAARSRTQVGMVKGTSGYMSPEQILGEPLDARSDLFSLGVVLHELLTGLRLFHAKTPQAGAGAVLHGQVPPPSRTNKQIPPELDAIVLKALGRKREDRYASTLEFARALERAVGPLIWHPEQNGELMQRLFAERREQTRQLLMTGQALNGEATGEVRVSQLFSLASINSPPPPPEPPSSALPQITPALSAPPFRVSPTPSSARPALPPELEEEPQTQITPPPPPPETQVRAPPPARSAPAPRRPTSSGLPAVSSASESPPRRPTSSGLPAVSSAEPVRRAVFEPLPQKRASTTTSAISDSSLPPPPPPEEPTSRTQPGDEPVRPRGATWGEETATRPAPPEEPRSEGRGRTVSRSEVVATRAGTQDEPRGARPSMTPNTQGTIPWGEASAAPQQPPAEDEEENTPLAKSSREGRTSTGRVRSSSSERVPPAGHAPPRSQRVRVPTPPPEESTEELVTRPVRVLPAPEEAPEEPASDTNETELPDDEPAGVVTSPHNMLAAKRRRGWLLATLALLVVLVGGSAAAVALGLDGGRVSALWSPPPPPERGALQPLVAPKPASRSAPAPTPPAPTPPAPTPPAPTPSGETVTAAGLQAAPSPAPAQPAASPEGSEAPATPTPPPPSEDLDLTLASPSPPAEEEAAPTQPTRKVRPPKRTTRKERPAEATAADSDWAPMDGKPSTPAEPAAEAGALTLVTEPYAKVYAGKRYLGETPLFKLSFASGRHTLRLVAPGGQNLRLTVEIKPGETTAVRVPLDQLASE